MNFEHDLFISHASEDKDRFVRPLANALRDLGVIVWYDEFTLSVGDSLSKAIDAGLAQSRYGAVVLSRNFIRKNWPEYEFRSLIALESGRSKRMLPIWYEISRAELLDYSPHVVDKVAIVADEKSPLEIALEIMRAASPKKFQEVKRRAAYRKKMLDSVQTAPVSALAMNPRLLQPLTQQQLRRLRLVQESIMEVFPQSWEEMVTDFQRDLVQFREQEIQHWEKIAGTYSHVARIFSLNQSEKIELFKHLIGATLGHQIPSAPTDHRWLVAAAEDFYGTLRNAQE